MNIWTGQCSYVKFTCGVHMWGSHVEFTCGVHMWAHMWDSYVFSRVERCLYYKSVCKPTGEYLINLYITYYYYPWGIWTGQCSYVKFTCGVHMWGSHMGFTCEVHMWGSYVGFIHLLQSGTRRPLILVPSCTWDRSWVICRFRKRKGWSSSLSRGTIHSKNHIQRLWHLAIGTPQDTQTQWFREPTGYWSRRSCLVWGRVPTTICGPLTGWSIRSEIRSYYDIVPYETLVSHVNVHTDTSTDHMLQTLQIV